MDTYCARVFLSTLALYVLISFVDHHVVLLICVKIKNIYSEILFFIRVHLPDLYYNELGRGVEMKFASPHKGFR